MAGSSARAEGLVLEHPRHLEDGVLAVAAAGRIVAAQPGVDVEQQQEGEAEDELHARAPELIELVAEEQQRVFDEPIAVPAEAGVEQVEAERPLTGAADVQADDVGLAGSRHQAQRSLGQVAVWVDQHHRRPRRVGGLGQRHKLTPAGAEQGRLALAALADQQLMAAQAAPARRGRG